MDVKQTSIYGVIAEFETDQQLLEAARAVRQKGYTFVDALTPFPIPGIDEVLGLKRSNLGYISLVTGIVGALTGLGVQWYTNGMAWPIVVHGKPFFALESSIPVTFELMVLFSAFGTLFGMLAMNRLPQLYHPVFNYSRIERASDDRFLLVIESKDPLFDPIQTAELLRSLGGKNVEVVPE